MRIVKVIQGMQYIASQTVGVCRQANHIKGMIHAEASSLRLQKLAEVTGIEAPLRVVCIWACVSNHWTTDAGERLAA